MTVSSLVDQFDPRVALLDDLLDEIGAPKPDGVDGVDRALNLLTTMLDDIREVQAFRRAIDPANDPTDLTERLAHMTAINHARKVLDRWVQLVKNRKAVVLPDLVDAMHARGLQAQTIGGYNTHLHPAVQANITKDNRAAAYPVLRRLGMGDLIEETVNSNSLSARIRELMLSEEGVPKALEEVVTITPTVDIRSTRKP